MVGAAVLAGISATSLGLVDAGHELDGLLARLEYEAAALHRATGNAVEHGASTDPMTRPRTSLRRTVGSLEETTNRIINETAPPYARWAARPLSTTIELPPSPATIERALNDYLEHTEKAQAETAKTASAIELRGRLLDLNYENLVQKIADARAHTRQAIARALAAVQFITLACIAIAALAFGLSGQAAPSGRAVNPYRR
jgi:hypothetical protein